MLPAIQVENSPLQLHQVKWTLWILEDVSPHQCKSFSDSHQSEKRPQKIHTEAQLTYSELCWIQSVHHKIPDLSNNRFQLEV